jgi:trehalose/maltose hydrolase-like predicted phosphorylase
VDAWVVGTRDARAEEPALLWNGLIGVRIARDGTGVPNGFFAIDEYDVQGEEKIRALPNPVGRSDAKIDPTQPYEQRLDLRNGVLTTRYVRPDGVRVTVEQMLHPTQRVFAERTTYEGGDREATVSLPEDYPVEVGDLPVRGIRFVDGKPSEDSKTATVPAKGKVEVTRVLSFGPSANGLAMRAERGEKEPVKTVHFEAPEPPSYDDVYQASLETWRRRWQTDIEIDGPVEDQQAIRSFLFYLRSAIHPDGNMAISPFGLSDTQYGGHVFWDADIWVFPALAFVDPQAAREIPEYRVAMLPAARRNYEEWVRAGRPTGGGPLGPLPKGYREWMPGAKYPWESSVTGKETVPGPSKFEDHITGSVYHALEQANMLGFVDPSQFSDVTRGATEFYTTRLRKRKDGVYDLPGTMSPDENHTGDNDLYTNLLAQKVIDFGLWKAAEADRPKLYLPKDEKTFLTYDDDRLRGYKQAAAVLSIYPLQYPPAEKQARAMMERFADKTIENGPAMTDSVHAVIWARLGEREKAYQAWKRSWEPFTRHPLMLFSEKRRRSKTYFTTGAGGALQSVLFGFLGMRLDWQKEPGSVWSTRLRGDAWLSVKPNLPPEWKSVKFKNFAANGRRYTLEASPTTVRVVPGG